MIDKREIIDIAATLSLTPQVVEKDYVLGWLLWGINNREELSSNWLFKGGTCLKKCFFETYRFSEDLDFTLQDQSHLNREFLSTVFSEICDSIYENTGIEFPPEMLLFDVYENPRGTTSCQGKVGYRGPVSPKGKNAPRIKLDLSTDEVIVQQPVISSIYHPYTDAPATGIHIRSYSYEETFGEKIRALAERTRPRDLYDVINLFRNDDARPTSADLLKVLSEKCKFKGIAVPTIQTLEPHKTDLEGAWASMLEHQLPALPPWEVFWEALPEFFAWLTGATEISPPQVYPGSPNEETIRLRSPSLHFAGSNQSFIEIIRFAAANRLCVELHYVNSTRLIEPYSLRRTQDGNVILHAHNVSKNEHRSYRVDRMQGAKITNRTFIPRHRIELTPTGPLHIPENPASALNPLKDSTTRLSNHIRHKK